jgi:hypothetical protein
VQLSTDSYPLFRVNFNDMMIVFQVSNEPAIGDFFTAKDGRKYQIITTPKDAGMQGGILYATARYTNKDVCWEKTFFFQVGD